MNLRSLGHLVCEESGYIGKETKRIGYFYTINRLSDQKQYVVVSSKLIPYKLPENPDEFIENYWLTKEEIRHKIATNEFDNINLLAALNIWFNQPKEAKTK